MGKENVLYVKCGTQYKHSYTVFRQFEYLSKIFQLYLESWHVKLQDSSKNAAVGG